MSQKKVTQRLNKLKRPKSRAIPRLADVEQELGKTLKRVRELSAQLSRKYPRVEVERILGEALQTPPDGSQLEGLDPKLYAAEFSKAAEELRQERHEFLGFTDVVKGLLMVFESPEERVRKNLSLEARD